MAKEKIRAIGSGAAAAALALLAGCSLTGGDYSRFEGYTQVSNAQKLYAELDSGHFYMQNNATGEKTVEFTFKYREDGQLTYMYTAADDDRAYSEYHNGSEINRKQEGQEWSFLAQGDEEYYSYSKENKHPYTTEGVISMNGFAVTDSTVERVEGGEKVSFKYDVGYLSGSFADMGTLKSFESSVWLNEEGYCRRIDQMGIFDNDGEKIYDYSMFIDMMNEVEEVERVG